MERGGNGIGLELSNTAPSGSDLLTRTYTHTQMQTHAVQALRPVIVPAGVTRCAPLFWAFI